MCAARLIDEIAFKQTAAGATESAILGPFFRGDAPVLGNGVSIVHGVPKDAEIVYLPGMLTDAVSKMPVVGAWIDVWQASTNSMYEQQDPEQVDCNLRGRFRSDERGCYGFYCLRPTPYPIPSHSQYAR